MNKHVVGAGWTIAADAKEDNIKVTDNMNHPNADYLHYTVASHLFSAFCYQSKCLHYRVMSENHSATKPAISLAKSRDMCVSHHIAASRFDCFTFGKISSGSSDFRCELRRQCGRDYFENQTCTCERDRSQFLGPVRPCEYRLLP